MGDLVLQSLLALAVIIGAVQLVGWLVSKLGQPRVIGEIVAGILLGPSVLGFVAPGLQERLFPTSVNQILAVLAQLGLVLFVFLVGLELDLGSLKGQGKRVAVLAQATVLVPVLLALPVAWVLHGGYGGDVDRTTFCVFIAAAMGITAFPVLARLLRETGLAQSRAGTVSLLCAALNDLAAWALLAVVVTLMEANGPGGVLRVLGLTTGLVLAGVFVVRPLLARLPDPPLWGVLLIALGFALASRAAGGHLVLGAFLAGVLMPNRPEWRASVESRLDGVVSALLLPIFFTMVGLSTRVDNLDTPGVWAVVLLVVVVATIGKFGGSTVAARLVGENRWDALTIGVLMNARGLTEIVFLTVGLQLGVISSTMFTVAVMMALVTTMIAAPALRLIERRRPATRPEVPTRPPEPAVV